MARRVELIARIVIARRAGSSTPNLSDLRSDQLGEQRAAEDIHPAASLRAATVTFEELYPAILTTEPVVDAERAVADAVVIQEVVGEIVLGAATGYVDHLLTRLNSVHLQERRALAGYLHDHTAQSIASALQRLDYVEVPLAELKHILDEALREVRAVALELRQFVGDQRLDEALASYITNFDSAAPPITLRQTGVPRAFPPLQQEAAFLVAREGLLNAVKHADAHVVTLDLSWRHGSLQITVADDGKGFDRQIAGMSRMGLVICRERAESISASLDIHSVLGEGTRLTLRVPL